MKKKYIKPQLYCEEFAVTENIASCDVPNHSHYSGGCAYDDGLFVFFYESTCEDDGETHIVIGKDNKPGSEEIFCTYGPTVGVVFNS